MVSDVKELNGKKKKSHTKLSKVLASPDRSICKCTNVYMYIRGYVCVHIDNQDERQCNPILAFSSKGHEIPWDVP